MTNFEPQVVWMKWRALAGVRRPCGSCQRAVSIPAKRYSTIRTMLALQDKLPVDRYRLQTYCHRLGEVNANPTCTPSLFIRCLFVLPFSKIILNHKYVFRNIKSNMAQHTNWDRHLSLIIWFVLVKFTSKGSGDILRLVNVYIRIKECFYN